MYCTEDVLIEDTIGLESEMERLLMTYGYPVEMEKGASLQAESEEKPSTIPPINT